MLRIRQTLQDDYAGAFTHHEAVGSAVERIAAGRRERGRFREADIRGGRHSEVDAAGDHDVHFTQAQAFDRVIERGQRRSAGRVQGDVAAANIEG